MSYAGKWDYTINTTKSKGDGRKLMMPHQQEAVNALNDYYDLSGECKTEQSGLLIMPTGSGKTFTTITWIMESAIPAGYRIIWFAHRQELVEQALQEFCRVAPILSEYGIKKIKILPISGQHAGMSQSSGYDINVCSIMSVATKNGMRFIRRMLGTPGARKVIIIIDEAHHAPMRSYQKVLDRIRHINPSMILLGLTATPKRLQDNNTLLKMFNVEQNKEKYGKGFIYEVSLQHLIQYEYLATPHYIPVNTDIKAENEYNIDEKTLQFFQKFGELSEELFDEIASNVARNKCIVNHYLQNRQKYGKTLIFAINQIHAKKLYRLFTEAGVSCDYVISGKANNHDVIQNFRDNAFEVLINVQMMTEGSDVPDIQTAFMTRETNSDSLFMQMVGRALRGPYAGGTKEAYIVDFHDKWEMLHFWFKPEELDIFVDANEGLAIEDEVENPEVSTQDEEQENEEQENEELLDDDETEAEDDSMPLERFLEIYSAISKDIKTNWEVISDLPRWPVGWYAIPDRPSVIVMNDQLGAYQDLQIYLSSIIEENRSCDFIIENYFVECTKPLINDIENILDYAKIEKKMPPYYELAETDAADPHFMAQMILERFPECVEELSGRAIYRLVEKYESSSRIQSLYPQFVSYRRAVENILSSYRQAKIFDEDERREYHLIDNYYDIDELTNEIFNSYPSLRAANIISICWSERVVKSWLGLCTKYNSDTYKIRINKLLSSPDVSKDAVKYILYHELLHANGLWAHDEKFRDTEWEFPNSDQLDGELDSLTNRYKIDYKELKHEHSKNNTSVIKKNDELQLFNPEAAGVIAGFKYCQNCGYKLPETARFCHKCGRPAIYD